MPTRRCATLLLMLCVPVGTASAQSSSPTLQEAERAFAAALASHDRSAFVAMLAPDVESTLPSVARGPEAIANAWLPFLIDPGTTMILTTTDVVVGPTGDSGSSSGTFAIRGRTANGVKTVPAGAYSFNWRLSDGRWKITAISGSATRSSETRTATTGSGNAVRPAANSGGIGAYRFGMSRDEVSRVAECAPYTTVGVTGGLECPHYNFDGREMNISFLFAGDRLRRIQLWFYDGESSVDAREAVGRILAFLQQKTGGAIVTGRPDVPAAADAIIGSINSAPPPRPGQIVQLEICGPYGTDSDRWFSRVGRHQYGYGVMLFAEPAAGR